MAKFKYAVNAMITLETDAGTTSNSAPIKDRLRQRIEDALMGMDPVDTRDFKAADVIKVRVRSIDLD